MTAIGQTVSFIESIIPFTTAWYTYIGVACEGYDRRVKWFGGFVWKKIV